MTDIITSRSLIATSASKSFTMILIIGHGHEMIEVYDWSVGIFGFVTAHRDGNCSQGLDWSRRPTHSYSQTRRWGSPDDSPPGPAHGRPPLTLCWQHVHWRRPKRRLQLWAMQIHGMHAMLHAEPCTFAKGQLGDVPPSMMQQEIQRLHLRFSQTMALKLDANVFQCKIIILS